MPPQSIAKDRTHFSGDQLEEPGFRLGNDARTATLVIESTVFHGSAGPIGGVMKRFVDVVFAGGALMFFLPLFGMIAGLIKLSDGGPVFYRHRRVGHRGQEFGCLKFRTMVTNGDEVLQQHLVDSAEAAREWEETRKLKSDPRVTTLGNVLRKLSIDELPQLINIIRGDMSLVGPRPIVSAEIAMYGPHAELYCRARPGLTGLWQVSGRNDKSYADRVVLDCTYVQNWSHRVDLVIILKTIPAVLSSRGTY
jgi:exopolysaccharide production protein ExoY